MRAVLLAAFGLLIYWFSFTMFMAILPADYQLVEREPDLVYTLVMAMRFPVAGAVAAVAVLKLGKLMQ